MSRPEPIGASQTATVARAPARAPGGVAVAQGSWRDAGKGAVGLAAAVVVWELLRLVAVLPRDAAPSFLDIVPAFFEETFAGPLGPAVGESVRAWGAGLAVTLLVAVPVGALVGLSRWADALSASVFDFLRPVPAVAFVPVAVVFFGVGLRMQVFLIAMASVWPVIFNTRFGVRSVDPLLLDTARTIGLGRAARLRRVVLPAALPSIFTGVRTAAAIAVVLTIVSELVASSTGIGGYINGAQSANLPAHAFAAVVMAGLFGYAVYLCFDRIEARVTGWHRLSAERGR